MIFPVGLTVNKNNETLLAPSARANRFPWGSVHRTTQLVHDIQLKLVAGIEGGGVSYDSMASGLHRTVGEKNLNLY